MPKLRVHNLAISLDGYAAGPRQSLDDPLGVGGERLHEWVFATDSNAPADGVDAGFVAEGDVGIGATIMGRNMFGPLRGPWDNDEWTGWWGEDPPYHHPVFVLTHNPRASVTMQGGTTFHFVDDGIEIALERAFDAADGADVRISGGAATVQQYLRAGLVSSPSVVHVRLARAAKASGGPASTGASR